MLHSTIIAVAVTTFIALLILSEASSHIAKSGVDKPTVDRNFWLGKLI